MRLVNPMKAAPHRSLRRRLAVTAAAVLLSSPLEAGVVLKAGHGQDLSTYENRLAAYRRGDFVAALRASAAQPIDRLRDEAEEFFHTFPGRSREHDLHLLAAAMLHFDLAGAAQMEPEKNESLGRNFLNRVTGGRRGFWLRDAHLGLTGFYADRGRLDDAVRVATFLGRTFREDRDVRFARARLAEFIGWGSHDERFLDQAQAGYEDLLGEEPAEGPVEDEAELRLRIAHLTLRAGDPEEALLHLDEAGDRLSAVQRFVSLLLRGETLLWLGRATDAEAAFEQAQAIHIGSVSAAAGLVASRQTLGDARGAAEAVRGFLSQSTGEDAWWSFLVRGLADEGERLDRLRGLILLGSPAPP